MAQQVIQSSFCSRIMRKVRKRSVRLDANPDELSLRTKGSSDHFQKAVKTQIKHSRRSLMNADANDRVGGLRSATDLAQTHIHSRAHDGSQIQASCTGIH
jgi:hypothetical protein